MVQKCWLFGNSTDPERPAPAERVWKVRIARLSQKAMIQHTPTDCLTTSGVLPTIEPGLKTGLVQNSRILGNTTDLQRARPEAGAWLSPARWLTRLRNAGSRAFPASAGAFGP